MRRTRLDAELVRRGLARSREHAVELIAAGRVQLLGRTAEKASTAVDPGAPLLVRDDPHDEGWASRGAHKLLGALAAFNAVDVTNRRCLDAGASTGGFTDVLLRRGAREVEAVDVGYGHLIWRLRNDDRVHVVERTNVRHLTPEMIGGPVDVVVADLSFISLTTVLPALVGCCLATADQMLMVKPQFEIGKDRLGTGGVVRDPDHRRETVQTVADRAAELGWGTAGVTASPLPGPSGNVEYFVWLRADTPVDRSATEDLIARAVQEGPQ